jgi:hypothetical protein
MSDHDKQYMQENLDQQLYRLEQKKELNDEPYRKKKNKLDEL